jgi:hypothetical protein
MDDKRRHHAARGLTMMRRARLAVLIPAVFCILGLGASKESRAQSGGHWIVSYANSGGFSWTATSNGGTVTSGTKSALHHTKFGGNSGYQFVSADMNVTTTATLTWVDSNNNPITPGPAHAYFREDCSSIADDLRAGTYSGTMNDSYSDPTVDYGYTIESAGRHLVQRDGTSGTITLSRTFTGHFQVSGVSQGYCMVDWGYSVTPDPRHVEVSASIDPTYYKAADGTRTQNVRADDGTLNGDTVYNINSVTYSAIATPADWTANSEYHWYSSLTGYWSSGVFSSSPIPDLSVSYWSWGNPVGSPGQQDHLYVHLIDSGDGANASGNYYLRLHDSVENFTTTVDTSQTGSRVRATPAINPGSNGGSYSFTVTNTVSFTSGATAQYSLTALQVAANLGFNLSSTYSSTSGGTLTFNLTANMYNWVDFIPFWHHREGTADVYDDHGFGGTKDWTADSAYHPQNPFIDFTAQLVTSSGPPTY